MKTIINQASILTENYLKTKHFYHLSATTTNQSCSKLYEFMITYLTVLHRKQASNYIKSTPCWGCMSSIYEKRSKQNQLESAIWKVIKWINRMLFNKSYLFMLQLLICVLMIHAKFRNILHNSTNIINPALIL